MNKEMQIKKKKFLLQNNKAKTTRITTIIALSIKELFFRKKSIKKMKLNSNKARAKIQSLLQRLKVNRKQSRKERRPYHMSNLKSLVNRKEFQLIIIKT